MKIVTLVIIRDASGRFLLMKREKNPNIGLWSPVGGKHEPELRESLHESAAREVREEALVDAAPSDLMLRGIATERGVNEKGDRADYMMFIFELLRWKGEIPPRGPEGDFAWFPEDEVMRAAIPETDREIFWPYLLKGTAFFSVAIEWDGRRVTSFKVEEERAA